MADSVCSDIISHCAAFWRVASKAVLGRGVSATGSCLLSDMSALFLCAKSALTTCHKLPPATGGTRFFHQPVELGRQVRDGVREPIHPISASDERSNPVQETRDNFETQRRRAETVGGMRRCTAHPWTRTCNGRSSAKRVTHLTEAHPSALELALTEINQAQTDRHEAQGAALSPVRAMRRNLTMRTVVSKARASPGVSLRVGQVCR